MKHYHILKRVRGLKDVFMCADSECSWTRRREYLTGKKFQCPYCSGFYIVTPDQLRRKTPHCRDCGGSPRVLITNPLVQKMVDGLTRIMPEVEDAD
jgi:transcription elongation factor Elf1